MPLKPLFGGFEPAIRDVFSAAKKDAGDAATGVVLTIEETPYHNASVRAEFLVLESSKQVRITWNGLASLWAFAQGAARLSRRMFDGKRSGQTSLKLADDAEARRGIDSLVMATRFIKEDVPEHAAKAECWPDWAPPIVIDPAEDSDDDTGNKLFLGALGWILRHEIAHIVSNHAERENTEGLTVRDAETEADLKATRWLKGSLKPDAARQAGVKPESEEILLEGRAIRTGMGLIWVALFEGSQTQQNNAYPPPAERLFTCLDELGLREDSAAAEILSDVIQAWIDPERKNGGPRVSATSSDALTDAVIDLQHFISAA